MTAALRAAVRTRLENDLPDRAGATRRSKLEGSVEEPEVPPAGEDVWDVFWSVRSMRSSDQPVSPADVADWCALARVEIGPTEFELVRAMDQEYGRCMSEHSDPRHAEESKVRDSASASDASGVRRVLESFRLRKG